MVTTQKEKEFLRACKLGEVNKVEKILEKHPLMVYKFDNFN